MEWNNYTLCMDTINDSITHISLKGIRTPAKCDPKPPCSRMYVVTVTKCMSAVCGSHRTECRVCLHYAHLRHFCYLFMHFVHFL